MVVLTVTNTSKAVHAMVINYFFCHFYIKEKVEMVYSMRLYTFFFVKLEKHTLTCASHKEEVVLVHTNIPD
jgi:hypothetical protein